MSARLNLKPIPYIPWKGRTFDQISTSIQHNGPNNSSLLSARILFRDDKPTTDNFIMSAHPIYKLHSRNKLIKNPLPLKVYRREFCTANIANCNPRISTKIDELSRPNGYITKQTLPNSLNQGLVNVQDQEDLNIPSNSTEIPGSCSCFTSAGVCLDVATNARRRVRSAGMVRKNSNQYTSVGGRGGQTNGCACGAVSNNQLQNVMTPINQYYTSAKQYLDSRTKSFEQNQYHNLKSGDPKSKPGTNQSINNVYGSNNNIPYCPNGAAQYVPVYYKPNNPQYAQQGGVTSSSRIARLKYDTITSNGALMTAAFGPQTANAMAYSGLDTTYTIKDKIGYPNIKTPVVCSGGGVKTTTCALVNPFSHKVVPR
jgi:hypothetical protein